MRILPVLLLAAGLAAAPAARAQFGIAVGVNFDELSDAQAGAQDQSFDGAQGFHVGVFYDLSLGPVALRPGVFYTDVGKLQDASSSDEIDLSLIEVPVDVRLRLPLIVASPYIAAGPVLRFSQPNDDGKITAKDFTLAGAAGAGVDFNLALIRPFVEARYQFGLSGIAETIGGVETTNGAELSSVMLRAGLKF